MTASSAFLDEFRIIETLGSGYTGEVLLGESNGQKFAIKKYKAQTGDIATLRQELHMMSQLEHPNIARLHSGREQALYKSKKGQETNCFAIILEYLEGGTLFDFLSYSGRFSPEICRTYFFLLIDALHHIHSKGIIHRDIKLENIMLDKTFNLQVIDFGFATYHNKGILHQRLGTDGYMAPQVNARNYQGPGPDLFAAGVLLFYLYNREMPFPMASKQNYYYNLISTGKFQQFWKYHQTKRGNVLIEPEFKDLMEHMLLPNPADRYTMEQVRTHSWTTGTSASPEKIFEEFSKRKQRIEACKERERQEQLRKNERMAQFNQIMEAERSGTEFGEFCQILDNLKVDQKLIPEAESIDFKDFVINESAKNFIALIIQFFSKAKESNYFIDNEQVETFNVKVDPEKFEVTINLNYTFLTQSSNCSVVARLRKTKDGQLAVRFLIDEEHGDYFKSQIIRLIKKQFRFLKSGPAKA